MINLILGLVIGFVSAHMGMLVVDNLIKKHKIEDDKKFTLGELISFGYYVRKDSEKPKEKRNVMRKLYFKWRDSKKHLDNLFLK